MSMIKKQINKTELLMLPHGRIVARTRLPQDAAEMKRVPQVCKNPSLARDTLIISLFQNSKIVTK